MNLIRILFIVYRSVRRATDTFVPERVSVYQKGIPGEHASHNQRSGALIESGRREILWKVSDRF